MLEAGIAPKILAGADEIRLVLIDTDRHTTMVKVSCTTASLAAELRVHRLTRPLQQEYGLAHGVVQQLGGDRWYSGRDHLLA